MKDLLTKIYHIIDSIIDKRKVNRKDEYKIIWKGFPYEHSYDYTWVSGKELDRTEDLKQMKHEFNQQQ